VAVSAEYSGETLDVSKSLYTVQKNSSILKYTPLSDGKVPQDQVGILFLAQSATGVACPNGVNVAYQGTNPVISGTGRGHAFHITSSAPVAAYDIYPYGGPNSSSPMSGATLLLPTSVWDTNYVVASAYNSSNVASMAGGANIPTNGGRSYILFVASEDGTILMINPVADIVGGIGVNSGLKGAPVTYPLNRGESIQFEQPLDLSGSALLANKPIGTWGGHSGMSIMLANSLSTVGGTDAAHQQIPPVSTLGSEYVAVRYRSRNTSGEETVPWRLIGAAKGTTLTYEPSAPQGAPSTVELGQVVEFESPGPFVVKSQDEEHSFYFAAHMTSSMYAPDNVGDPETVNIIPPRQFLSRYVFFTDLTFKETNLVVVRYQGGPHVYLDCLNKDPLTGWKPVGERYEYTRVDVQKGGFKAGNCDNGRHEMYSDKPFGLTVWGWDTQVSYAFPAGAAVRPINSKVAWPQLE
jgi:hypothetical protein